MTSKIGHTIRYWAPPLLLCGLIYWQSAHSIPSVGPDLPHIDKLVHFGVYALLGALFLRALRATQGKISHSACLAWSIALAGLYGLGDEVHQHFVPWRSAEALDVVADVAGSAGGVLLLHVFMRKRKGTDSRIDKSGASG